jgi:hypothetical protein
MLEYGRTPLGHILDEESANVERTLEKARKIGRDLAVLEAKLREDGAAKKTEEV